MRGSEAGGVCVPQRCSGPHVWLCASVTPENMPALVLACATYRNGCHRKGLETLSVPTHVNIYTGHRMTII